MKFKHSLILGSLLFLSISVFAQDKVETQNAPAKPAQEKKSKATPAPTKKPATQKSEAKTSTSTEDVTNKERRSLMEYPMPGEMHVLLSKSNGEWQQDITYWMSPGSEPVKAEVACTNTMILGGRYQESVVSGKMNGMNFEGKSIVGFDNAKKMFQSTWIDNMGTGIMFMEGKYNAETYSITFKGKFADPATGIEENVREEMKFLDENTQSMEMYITKKGKEFKTMEIIFKRKL